MMVRVCLLFDFYLLIVFSKEEKDVEEVSEL
jgi:hypothetical protein